MVAAQDRRGGVLCAVKQGAFPPVSLGAVCFVRAIAAGYNPFCDRDGAQCFATPSDAGCKHHSLLQPSL